MNDMRDEFFVEILNIMRADERVVFLFADMGAQGLAQIRKEFPSRSVNVGVAEQNMVNVAAGLALAGKKVIIYSIAAFATQRCYEQIKVAVCGMGLPVVVVGMGPGISYAADGPTHHAVSDIASLGALAGISILSPCDEFSVRAAVREACAACGPVYIRLDKGAFPALYASQAPAAMTKVRAGTQVLIIASGVLTHEALAAAQLLEQEGISTGVVDVFRIKPFDHSLLKRMASGVALVVSIEEHVDWGGMSAQVSKALAGTSTRHEAMTLREEQPTGYGDRAWYWREYGMDATGIARSVRDIVHRVSMSSVNSTGLIQGRDCAKTEWLTLTEEDFSRLLGISVNEMSSSSRDFIAKTDFRYRHLSAEEREKVIIDSLRVIDSGNLSVSGPHRRDVWEKGWSENLKEFEASGGDENTLVPKFVRTNTIKRLCGDYIEPYKPGFETTFVQVLRMVVLGHYLKNVRRIFEFGCGTGHNLFALASLFPDKEFYGLDWAASSRATVDRLAEVKGIPVRGILFDLFNPDSSVDLGSDDGVFTIGALEQLGTGYEAFLSFLLQRRPRICVHMETMNEFYDRESIEDYIALRYTRQRGYLWGFLERLRVLERSGTIRIHDVRRTFGSQYHEGYSFVVWSPKENAGLTIPQ
jgi:transketolase C-terminal domain/subunit/SAM-dependent methyltransferase